MAFLARLNSLAGELVDAINSTPNYVWRAYLYVILSIDIC
jgi:hypothetical protein